MAITLEQINSLRSQIDVTYEEARRALEESNGDMVAAIILLEREGKQTRAAAYGQGQANVNRLSRRFADGVKRAFAWCCSNHFEAKKNEQTVIRLPFLLFLPLLLMSFPCMATLFIIGLFFGFRYYVYDSRGLNQRASEPMSRLADMADQIKREAGGSDPS